MFHNYSFTQVEKCFKEVKATMERVVELLEASHGNNNRHSASTRVNEKFIINGQNVQLMATRDGYSFGLHLLDLLFTPEELSKSLVYSSKKSSKPALDRDKVSFR